MTSQVNPGVKATELPSSEKTTTASRVRSATPSVFTQTDSAGRAPSPFLNPPLDGVLKSQPSRGQSLHHLVPKRPQKSKWQPSSLGSSFSRFKRVAKKKEEVKATAHELAKKVDLKPLKELLEKNEKLINAVDADGNTLLHLAIEGGYSDCISYLVNEAKADLKIQDAEGKTPFHLAVKHPEHLRILLLKSKEEVGITDAESNTPLHLAAKSGKNDSLVLLIILGKANVEVRNSIGETPLHTAARAKKPQCVAKLISVGRAKVNSQNNRGNTPLHLALEKGCYESVKALVEHKDINVHLKNGSDLTPLKYAESARLNKKHPKTIAAFNARPRR